MENISITLSGKGLHDTKELNIQVSVAATINITAKTAQRKATAWLVSEIGNMLMAGVPQLVISRQTVWRVPTNLTSTQGGPLGQVGTVDVDAESGQLVITTKLREELLKNVEHLIGSVSLSAS